MINLIDGKMHTPSSGEEKIVRWEVWFQTPFGLYAHLELAIDRCVKNDLPAALTVKPVAVAVGERNSYEVFPS